MDDPAANAQSTASAATGPCELGARLLAARVASGMSTHRLGLWLGRSHGLISRWERGLREPTLFDLDRLATVLRVDLDALLGELPGDARRRGCSSRAHSRSRRRALGETLAAQRVEAGLGIWEVYQATGIDGRRLRQIEAGADPGIREAVRLIALYGTTPRSLMRAAKERHRRSLDFSGGSPMKAASFPGQPPGHDGAA